MKVFCGIDVGHTTGLAVVAYFESSKKPVVYVSNSYAINQLGKFTSDLWEFLNLYKPDEVLVEYPETTKHMTYKPELLKNLNGIMKDILAKVKNVREVRPTDWKQTPAITKEFRYGQQLITRHEEDAAKMCYWAAVYGKKKM
jgi:hypothetical protein